jgi:hypothetical protein
MKFQTLCHVFFYHDYLVFVFGGDWGIMRSKLYFRVTGNGAMIANRRSLLLKQESTRGSLAYNWLITGL